MEAFSVINRGKGFFAVENNETMEQVAEFYGRSDAEEYCEARNLGKTHEEAYRCIMS